MKAEARSNSRATAVTHHPGSCSHSLSILKVLYNCLLHFIDAVEESACILKVMVLKTEYAKSPSTSLPSSVPSCRSLSSSEDGPSGQSSLLNGELARNLQDSIKHRILYLAEQLRVEKTSRDENTMGYLKLVSRADRHQAPHIRQAFEKVNQRTSATIAQIERRLRQCHQQLRELEEGYRPKDSVLKAEGKQGNSCESPTQDRKESLAASWQDGAESCLAGSQPGKFPEPRCGAQHRNLLLHQAKGELKEVKQLPSSLQVSCQSLKHKYLMDLQLSLESLQEEKCRRAVLEEQVNEHLQGHLDEIYHLKQSLAATEEKMAYLSYERAKEIWVRMWAGLQAPSEASENDGRRSTPLPIAQTEARATASRHPLARVPGQHTLLLQGRQRPASTGLPSVPFSSAALGTWAVQVSQSKAVAGAQPRVCDSKTWDGDRMPALYLASRHPTLCQPHGRGEQVLRVGRQGMLASHSSSESPCLSKKSQRSCAACTCAHTHTHTPATSSIEWLRILCCLVPTSCVFVACRKSWKLSRAESPDWKLWSESLSWR
ncbi:testis-specific protein TEX28 isoform X1 [Oryctolagus cuniculus]|uniref:testis-specific protein TEX28 isoform X1 n=1 Tax=Oryctolagus cuniculus TaxID=9986 RepID=UPI00387A4C6A